MSKLAILALDTSVRTAGPESRYESRTFCTPNTNATYWTASFGGSNIRLVRKEPDYPSFLNYIMGTQDHTSP